MPTVAEDRQQRIQEFNLRVGRNVRGWREHQGMAQGWLAELADMSQSQLSRIEAGERSITFKQALLIKAILEVAYEDLIATDIEWEEEL